MYFGFFKLRRCFSSVIRISKTSTMNQDKCYFRYIDNEDRVDISFLFKVKDSLRHFNFIRKPSENMQTLYTRIATNIQKVYSKKNKKKGTNVENIDVKILDSKSNLISQDCLCSELFTFTEPLKLIISDQSLDIVLNAPWIINVSLPNNIMVGFTVFPENLQTLYTEKERNIYNWYKGKVSNSNGNEISEIHIQWSFIVNSFSYTPNAEDIGLKLKLECIPVNSSQSGPVVECISKNFVEAGPGRCPFEKRHMFTSSKLNGNKFRCVSYNILADLYCDSDYAKTMLHPYCPPYALHIDYRKQLVTKELKGYNADIICLQEVDSKIFTKSLKPFMNYDNFNGLFYKKGNSIPEGLACFYNKHRFRFVEDYHISLGEALQSEACVKGIFDTIKDNTFLIERILDRPSVASATILQSIENPNEILVVGNTHLYFHPDSDHIRLIQGGIFIYWIGEVKKKLMEKNVDRRISVILFGDYNSLPSCGIYQLFTTGVAPNDLEDWQSNANEAVHGLTLTQDILLDSACGTPKYTNFTQGFAECIDYIFYEKNNMCVTQVVPFPDEEELRAHIALPSVVFPSDHIALISDFEFN